MESADALGLSIELDEQQLSHHPGDLIQGSLTVRLVKDSAVGKVTIRLVGHTKSKIVQSNGQSTSTFRGKAILFNREQILHDDHYTHKSGLLSWPFKFQIPESVDLANVKEKWKTRDGFLTPSAGAHSIPLPPSFQLRESSSNKKWHCFTAYSIEAEVAGPRGSQALRSKTKCTSKAIRVLPCPMPAAIDMDNPQQRHGSSQTFVIRTLRLLPEHTTERLSMMQRTKSLLQPSSLPKFTFELDISYPSLIQAYHTHSLPFVVAAIPKTDAESTTIHPDMRTFYRYPPLKLKRFQLILRATTMCRCPSLLSEVTATATHDTILVDRDLDEMLLGMRSLAWDQKNRVEDNAPTSIDLGRECDVRVTKESRSKTNKHSKPGVDMGSPSIQTVVTPSFTGYNVSRKYHLAWKLDFECAQEKIEFKGQSPREITILGPPASLNGDLPPDDFWMMPPDDDSDSDDEMGKMRRTSSRETLPAYSELPGSASGSASTSRVMIGAKR